MIDSYSNVSQSVEANGTITFAINDVRTCNLITHAGGTGTFTINRPGYYKVDFTGSGSVTDATAANVTVQLYNNGTAIPGATATFYSAAPINIGSLSFSKIIYIPPSCCAVNNRGNLTIQNIGAAATFTNVNLAISRIPKGGNSCA